MHMRHEPQRTLVCHVRPTPGMANAEEEVPACRTAGRAYTTHNKGTLHTTVVSLDNMSIHRWYSGYKDIAICAFVIKAANSCRHLCCRPDSQASLLEKLFCTVRVSHEKGEQ